MSRQCQGGPNGTEPGAMRQRGNGTGRAAEGCSSVSVAFPLTMMITGIVGNALAMLLVSRSYRAKGSRRKRSFLLCIGSLAITDLLGQLLTSPIVISVYLSDLAWEAVDPSGHLCAFFGFSMTVFGLCPLFIASAMAVERTLAIRAPHWYASHMKTRVTKMVLLGIWLAVVTFALLPVTGLGQYTLQWPGTWCFISTGDSQLTGSLIFASTFTILGLLSLVVTLACNLATIEALVSRCRTKATTTRSSKQWGRIAMETLIQLLGIMCVLSACWSPLLVGRLVSHHGSLPAFSLPLWGHAGPQSCWPGLGGRRVVVQIPHGRYGHEWLLRRDSRNRAGAWRMSGMEGW
ncbi:prostaglandin e2 receptor ep3 subtype [Limosa lapponica baueri]|uniref:Prostaglandin E2 receptor EP3 subtype n=1 Tax=Limosa lapponica baueri TaxID=1758121 RepID=A0A2I0T1U5_LIMLA|nr:prostaglandin e2 receptor ep3 subtype [Limosa lapponica baueri]